MCACTWGRRHVIHRGTGTHDLILLASKSVSDASIRLFEGMGCHVIVVEDIENPFARSTLKNKGFLFMLNKLHAWNLTDYERVVYSIGMPIILSYEIEMRINCFPEEHFVRYL